MTDCRIAEIEKEHEEERNAFESRLISMAERQMELRADLHKAISERDEWKAKIAELEKAIESWQKEEELWAECDRLRMEECKEWKAKYEAAEWLRNDQGLRTYDGLTEKLDRYECALKFIADGCLVPPDGGSPRHPEDCMKAAREALKGAGG